LRYLVVSDIHANLEAFDAVLTAAAGERFDRVLILGDLVGYGADPNAVVDRIRAMPAAAVIRGNHDKVAAGLSPSASFNHLARAAVAWTARTLTADNLAYVGALPMGPIAVDDMIEICHGTPFDEDVYVFDELDALRSLRAAKRPLCLFGHTHVPAAFEQAGDSLRPLGPGRTALFEMPLTHGARWLVNCGAVGQPRDSDWRAAYGVVDTDNRMLAIIRVEYDVQTAQRKILEAGLPEMLAERLSVGR
jgi:diadenosine tetraphosphatase ApaH/serine/threonine PP2A family protein phosphatase